MQPARPVHAATLSGKFKQLMTVGPHRFVADEPVADGGEDYGPNPFELVAAGLAACTSMTVKMYADHKGWALRHVDAAVTAVREAGSLVLKRVVRFDGDLDETQRARLLEIANRCPVHRALSGAITIETAVQAS